MKRIAVALLAILSQLPHASSATSLCVRPSVQENFEYAKVVVAASATDVSIKQREPSVPPTQTILWRVSKSWKGPYREGGFFTTRNRLDLPISKGNAMLLFLTDREPYSLDTICTHSGRLEDSLDDVLILGK